ncbi:phosphopantothenoylcysteine decarboxylase [Aureococcus anophagefferens]|nr:phosphopantothenoylcysteine decarboxylase [Aureococcus anophagefferens]
MHLFGRSETMDRGTADQGSLLGAVDEEKEASFANAPPSLAETADLALRNAKLLAPPTATAAARDPSLPLVSAAPLGTDLLTPASPPTVGRDAIAAAAPVVAESLGNPRVREMLEAFRAEGPDALRRFAADAECAAVVARLRGVSVGAPAPAPAPARVVGRRPRVLLGATGSVATVKVPKLALALSEVADVRVVVTEKAKTFLAKAEAYDAAAWATFQASGIEVLSDADEWDAWQEIGDDVVHVELRKWADLLVVAPLSANSLAKLANGLCDDLLSCTARAWDFDKPFVVAPAMNTAMWTHPLTATHLADLRVLGVAAVPPASKKLACGDVGPGALADVPPSSPRRGGAAAPKVQLRVHEALLESALAPGDAVGVCLTGMERTLLEAPVVASFDKYVRRPVVAAGATLDAFVVLADGAGTPLGVAEHEGRERHREHRGEALFADVRAAYGAAAKRRSYAWLYRLRTDTVFFLEFAPFRMAPDEDATDLVYVPFGGMSSDDRYTCLNDHFFACPRHACRGYFELLELFEHLPSRTGFAALEPYFVPPPAPHVASMYYWFRRYDGAEATCYPLRKRDRSDFDVGRKRRGRGDAAELRAAEEPESPAPPRNDTVPQNRVCCGDVRELRIPYAIAREGAAKQLECSRLTLWRAADASSFKAASFVPRCERVARAWKSGSIDMSAL